MRIPWGLNIIDMPNSNSVQVVVAIKTYNILSSSIPDDYSISLEPSKTDDSDQYDNPCKMEYRFKCLRQIKIISKDTC